MTRAEVVKNFAAMHCRSAAAASAGWVRLAGVHVPVKDQVLVAVDEVQRGQGLASVDGGEAHGGPVISLQSLQSRGSGCAQQALPPGFLP